MTNPRHRSVESLHTTELLPYDTEVDTKYWHSCCMPMQWMMMEEEEEEEQHSTVRYYWHSCSTCCCSSPMGLAVHYYHYRHCCMRCMAVDRPCMVALLRTGCLKVVVVIRLEP
jgi:hypothetical protein